MSPSITWSHMELDSLSIKPCEVKEKVMNYFFFQFGLLVKTNFKNSERFEYKKVN